VQYGFVMSTSRVVESAEELSQALQAGAMDIEVRGTNGQNDMVLDNWGEVRTWTAKAPITSNAPSGIGFVNFGMIDRLDVQAPVKTFGTGARGFNVYDGSLRHASFASIATHGNGSVGVQVSKPLPILEIMSARSPFCANRRAQIQDVDLGMSAQVSHQLVQRRPRQGAVTLGDLVRIDGVLVRHDHEQVARALPQKPRSPGLQLLRPGVQFGWRKRVQSAALLDGFVAGEEQPRHLPMITFGVGETPRS